MGLVPPRLKVPPPNRPGMKPPPNCPGVNPESPLGGVKPLSPESGMLELEKPKPSKLGARVQSICVSVWLIVASVWVIVSLRFWVRVSVDAWFDVMPAGMDIIIAMQNPNAIITNSALTLRLEIFLTALVNTPIYSPFQSIPEKKDNPEGRLSRGECA